MTEVNRWGVLEDIDPKCQQCKNYTQEFGGEIVCLKTGDLPEKACDQFEQATDMDIIIHKMDNEVITNHGCVVEGFEDQDLTYQVDHIGFSVVTLTNNKDEVQTLIYKTGFDGSKQLIDDPKELKKIERWMGKHCKDTYLD